MSLKRSITFIVCLVIAIILHPAVYAQSPSTSPFIFNVKSAQCNHKPMARNQTGFRVKDDKLVGIVTALHGVADCTEIAAIAKDGTEYKHLEIIQVDIDRDAALLWSPQIASLTSAGLSLATVPVEKQGDALYVIGYPLNLDAQLPTMDLSLRGMVELTDLIPANADLLKSLFKRKSPYMGIQVLSIEGDLLPGHSGSPIFNQVDEVVGIGNGGLDLGRVGIAWAVPWQQIEWKIVSPAISDSISEVDIERLKTLRDNDPLFFSFDPSDQDQETTIVEKTVCRSAIGVGYGNIDEFKQDLLNTAKKEAVGELFGELLQGNTKIEDSSVTEDLIQASTAGFVRVAGSPEYKNHEANLAEACVSIKAYITPQDKQALKPEGITSDKVCITDNLPPDDLKTSAEEQAVIRALLNYEPRLEGWNKDQLLPLMKEKEFIDGRFDQATGAYCTQVEGFVLPIEVKALTDSATPSPTSSPIPTLSPGPTKTLTPTTPINPTTPLTPSGKLAISLQFGFNPRVYITAFDGVGVNSGNHIAVTQARQPVWSQDGNSIMVNGNIDGVQGLFKLDAIAFNKQVIIDRGSAHWPVLSPDGSEILFSDEALKDLLLKRDVNGKIDQIMLNNRPFLGMKHLVWSDDNIIVFQGCRVWEIGHEGECGVWITNASNLAPQRIIEGNYAVPMDAKGGWLTYVMAQDGDWDVYLMPLSGGASINLTDNTAQDGLPTVSPDGKMVAYVSNETGTWAVWTVTIEGKQKQKWFDIDPQKGSIDANTWADERMSWGR